MPDQSDRELIATLRGLAEKATPGPWTWEPGYGVGYVDAKCGWIGLSFDSEDQDQPIERDNINAALAIAIRNALPHLLALAERGIQEPAP